MLGKDSVYKWFKIVSRQSGENNKIKMMCYRRMQRSKRFVPCEKIWCRTKS